MKTSDGYKTSGWVWQINNLTSQTLTGPWDYLTVSSILSRSLSSNTSLNCPPLPPHNTCTHMNSNAPHTPAPLPGSWLASRVWLLLHKNQECFPQEQPGGGPTEDQRTHWQRKLCHQRDRGTVQTEKIQNTKEEVLQLVYSYEDMYLTCLLFVCDSQFQATERSYLI